MAGRSPRSPRPGGPADTRRPVLFLGATLVLAAALAYPAGVGQRWMWLLLVLAVGAIAWSAVTAPDGRTAETVRYAALAAAAGGAVNGTTYGFGLEIDAPAVRIAVSLALAGAAWWSARAAHRLGPVTPALLFVVAQTVVLLVWLARHPVTNDVAAILDESAAYLRAGHNPYTLTYENRYPPEITDELFGPGFVVDGRIPYGFPYPPIVLLGAALGQLLGDVRFVPTLAYAALALAVHGRGDRARNRAAAVALVSLPGTVWLSYSAWTEPLSVALLGFALLAWQRGRFAIVAVLLGALLVSKQYLPVLLPLLWLLRARATRRRVALLALTAAVLVLPWLLADPRAFVRGVVGYPMATPWRRDSVSLAVELVDRLGLGDNAVLRSASLAAGLLVALVLARRAAPTPPGFAVSAGLATLTTVLLSKQSHYNYYFFACLGLVLAATLVEGGDAPAVLTTSDPTKDPTKEPTEDTVLPGAAEPGLATGTSPLSRGRPG